METFELFGMLCLGFSEEFCFVLFLHIRYRHSANSEGYTPRVGRLNMVRCASDGVFKRYPSDRVGRELVNFQGLVLSLMTMSVMVYKISGQHHRRN